MKTLILCGGKGTRAYPYTQELPKPLMPIGDRPILRHLMEIYARQGLEDFVLAGGYLVERLQEFKATLPATWSVRVVDTGADTGTAGRISQCADHIGNDTFFVTYGDGLGNVDLRSLVEFHHAHPGAATVTAVPLPSPYGTLKWDDAARVIGFTEKPYLQDHWINAGFFVFDPSVFATWAGDDLEREVLPQLAAERQLYVYKHVGFWRSMDTYKDALELSALEKEAGSPWTALPVSQS